MSCCKDNDGLFHTCRPAVQKFPLLKLLCVHGMDLCMSCKTLADWSNHCRMRLISSARHSGAWPENDWCSRHVTLYYTHRWHKLILDDDLWVTGGFGNFDLCQKTGISVILTRLTC